MSLGFKVLSSKIGELLVAGTQDGIIFIKHGKNKERLAADFLRAHEDAQPVKSGYIAEACKIITAYLNGKERRLDLVVQTSGTDFQRNVWREVRKIPYGKTASYSDIAKAVNAPSAFRAVANACGTNPVPLIIPCHRIIHKNGDMHGFGWDLKVKKFLLELESARSA